MKKKNAAGQLDLFSPETAKVIKVHAAIEQLKKQFGEGAVFLGAQLPVNPSGRPRRGKRTPDKKRG